MEENSKAMVMVGGKFRRLCSTGFVNNQYGANMICKKLGYQSGQWKKIEPGRINGNRYQDDGADDGALHLGECEQYATDLDDCAGWSEKKLTHLLAQDCTAPMFEIECEPSSSDRGMTRTCQGNQLIHGYSFGFFIQN